ncbi:MAG: PTS sugar transporter subunit IIA [Phycisphaerae bacterium]|nr:PTS sugar transporter subunit IIA [Phycisphaerae bacterium]
MRLEPLLELDLTAVLSGVKNRDAALDAVAERGASKFPVVTRSAFMAALKERESKYPTGTPEGVAFPHALLPEVPRTALVCLLLRPAVKWSTQNHPGQDVIFGILGNVEAPWEHVRLLARLARIVRSPGALERVRSCADGKGLLQRLIEEDRAHG